MNSERIGNCTLIHGDCREVIPGFSGINALVTDPPYRVTSGGNTGCFGGWMQHDYANSGEIVACDIGYHEWLEPVFASLADHAHAYIFSNDRNLSDIRHCAEDAGFKFHRLLAWDKRSAMPNRWYIQNCEFILFMRKGKAFPITDCGTMALQSLFQRDEGDHPTEKPVPLLEVYIRNSTKPSDIVLDPFMGSGSTGVASVRLQRCFVGIEIEQKHFDTACRRIEAAHRQADLFVQ